MKEKELSICAVQLLPKIVYWWGSQAFVLVYNNYTQYENKASPEDLSTKSLIILVPFWLPSQRMKWKAYSNRGPPTRGGGIFLHYECRRTMRVIESYGDARVYRLNSRKQESTLIRSFSIAFLSLIRTQTIPQSPQIGFRRTTWSPYRFPSMAEGASSGIPQKSNLRWRGFRTAPSNPIFSSDSLAPFTSSHSYHSSPTHPSVIS
ncbi:hypothetical protein TNCV_3652671 [Trichonephila clavipes]|nr:hypothetical protein TNCV_3652671 [Trichonephila clavipes]